MTEFEAQVQHKKARQERWTRNSLIALLGVVFAGILAWPYALQGLDWLVCQIHAPQTINQIQGQISNGFQTMNENFQTESNALQRMNWRLGRIEERLNMQKGSETGMDMTNSETVSYHD